MLAIGAFAGLRPESEIARLDWRDIDMDARTLFVHADNKTGENRTVKMSDNLFAWLLPHRKRKGKVMPANARKMRVKAMKDAKVKAWPVDVLRHTFATFHVLEHDSMDKTAEQCGHSVEMLKKHYLNRDVKPAEAKAFWSILPSGSATNVVPFKQESAA
jgi:integrase